MTNELAAFVEFPELRHLPDPRRAGWLFVTETEHDGEIAGVMAAERWPEGSADVFAFKGLCNAMGLHRAPDHSLRRERSGGIAEVVDALLALPAPTDRLAPSRALRRGPASAGAGVVWLYADTPPDAAFLRVGAHGKNGLLAWSDHGKEAHPAGGSHEATSMCCHCAAGTVLPQPIRSETERVKVVHRGVRVLQDPRSANLYSLGRRDANCIQ
ncbi:hypothetical protein GCM10022222_51500 [Amycolatopsis ultiminotia]|uniref:Uncharacterized protein n=1 Tax=Amycolatopsis ultiminotia TaxID=543629 RepID=A0ABP6X749_9PSEU